MKDCFPPVVVKWRSQPFSPCVTSAYIRCGFEPITYLIYVFVNEWLSVGLPLPRGGVKERPGRVPIV